MVQKDILFDLVNDKKTVIDYRKLYPLAEDEDSEVRQFVAELLARDHSFDSEIILVGFLKDEDELVRAEAADSLSYYSGDNVLSALMSSCKDDESEIVRSYALLSYWDVYFGDNPDISKESIAKTLSELNEFENSLLVKLEYAGLLYLCGDLDMLDYLLLELNNSDHYIRNTVMNNLLKVSNEDNIHFIQEALKPYYKNESVNFVKKKMGAVLCYSDDVLDSKK
jgi:hypothetical protein